VSRCREKRATRRLFSAKGEAVADNPLNSGEDIVGGIPGIDFLLKLLGVGPKEAPTPSPGATALPAPVAAPVYRDGQGRPYDYPVDAQGKPLLRR